MSNPAREQAPAGPVLRALLAEVTRVRARDTHPARVLDVGGGSGAWAVPLAAQGCAVTVVDPSPNALAALSRRARDAGVDQLVTPVQGDVDSLADGVVPGGADLVLGHGIIEVVDDVGAATAALAAAAAPGGVVSVLVASRYAAVLSRTLAGRLTEAAALLSDPRGIVEDDVLRRRLDAAALQRLLEAAGLVVELLRGDGVLDGWVPGALRDGGAAATADITRLEQLAAGVEPLRDVATRLHALARSPHR